MVIWMWIMSKDQMRSKIKMRIVKRNHSRTFQMHLKKQTHLPINFSSLLEICGSNFFSFFLLQFPFSLDIFLETWVASPLVIFNNKYSVEVTQSKQPWAWPHFHFSSSSGRAHPSFFYKNAILNHMDFIPNKTPDL